MRAEDKAVKGLKQTARIRHNTMQVDPVLHSRPLNLTAKRVSLAPFPNQRAEKRKIPKRGRGIYQDICALLGAQPTHPTHDLRIGRQAQSCSSRTPRERLFRGRPRVLDHADALGMNARASQLLGYDTRDSNHCLGVSQGTVLSPHVEAVPQAAPDCPVNRRNAGKPYPARDDDTDDVGSTTVRMHEIRLQLSAETLNR